MKSFSRSERVGGLIQRNLSDLLHKKVKDPRLKDVTITGVKLTSDLKLARIYYVVSGDAEHKKDVASGLERARGFLKRELASCLELRYMPDLLFHYDESFDYGAHIDKLLKDINAD